MDPIAIGWNNRMTRIERISTDLSAQIHLIRSIRVLNISFLNSFLDYGLQIIHIPFHVCSNLITLYYSLQYKVSSYQYLQSKDLPEMKAG